MFIDDDQISADLDLILQIPQFRSLSGCHHQRPKHPSIVTGRQQQLDAFLHDISGQEIVIDSTESLNFHKGLASAFWRFPVEVLCRSFSTASVSRCPHHGYPPYFLLSRHCVFRAHRAAANAVSAIGDVIVFGCDCSVGVWNANAGALISAFEEHHA
jgi:hypothetical protein